MMIRRCSYLLLLPILASCNGGGEEASDPDATEECAMSSCEELGKECGVWTNDCSRETDCDECAGVVRCDTCEKPFQ